MKKLFLTLFTLTSLVAFYSCGSSTEQKSEPLDTPAPADSSKVTAAYICPCGHCGFEGGNEPGECPKCGMELQASK